MSKSSNAANIMNRGISRSIFRWVHIIFGIPIIGYIYSPFQELPNYAPVVRNVAVPVIAISGLWMWKGHVVRRLISKRRLDKTLQRTAAGMAVKTRQEFEA